MAIRKPDKTLRDAMIAGRNAHALYGLLTRLQPAS
jgi:hypothetical protein